MQSLIVFGDQGSTREQVDEILESVVSYGDLVEESEITGTSRGRLLYLAPPTYVEISSTLFLLIGVVPDNSYPLPDALLPMLEYASHCRRLRVTDRLGTINLLRQTGFGCLTPTLWLKSPDTFAADDILSQYEAVLNNTGPPGQVEGLQILDSQRPVGFYPGRWTMLKTQSGNFVARRPQPYGAPLWCYAKVKKGILKHLLDLPALETRWRPCDEAWHIQQAIDRVQGTPQFFRCRPASNKTTVVDFFSPVPLWARRRWDSIGLPALRDKCLFSYSFARTDVTEELKFARESMWLEEIQNVMSGKN
jgi:hypothetical protein